MSRSTNQTTVKISGSIKAQTDKAILILATQVNGTHIYPEDPHKSKSVWFPKSQVMSSFKTPVPGELDHINVFEWIAIKTKEIEDALRESRSTRTKTELSGNPGFTGKDSTPYRGTGGGRSREDDEGFSQNYDYGEDE